jgi:hypothetical protein
MVTTLAAFVAFAAAPQSDAAALASKMLKYYYGAETMTGTIVYTAYAGGGQAQMTTALQFERPSKLYIRQAKGGSVPEVWMITSDGKFFSYDAPANLMGSQPGSQIGAPGMRHERLIDSVVTWDSARRAYTSNTVREIYAVGAANLGDRSIPLDVAIGRPEDLKHDSLEWVDPVLGGKKQVNGVEVNVITGKWRPYGDAQVAGDFELDVTDAGQLIRYGVQRMIGDPDRQLAAQKLVEVWDVNLVMNGKPDPALFKVVK